MSKQWYTQNSVSSLEKGEQSELLQSSPFFPHDAIQKFLRIKASRTVREESCSLLTLLLKGKVQRLKRNDKQGHHRDCSKTSFYQPFLA